MLTGSIVAIVTPMHEDGSLDLESLHQLIDWHVSEGTRGIVVVGTTGESPTVDFDEHRLLIKSAVEWAAGRIPVIAGTGANSTSEAIELAEYAKSAGADMSLTVVPYYNKPTQEGLYRHFRAIAEAVDALAPGLVEGDQLRVGLVRDVVDLEAALVVVGIAAHAVLRPLFAVDDHDVADHPHLVRMGLRDRPLERALDAAAR